MTLTNLSYDGEPTIVGSLTLYAGGYSGNWDSTSSGQVQFRESTVSVINNEPTAKVYVTRVGGGKGAVGVGWLSVDGTALSGIDYTGGSGSLSWADGDVSTKTIAIKLKNNSPVAKSFSIQLNNPAIATIGTPDKVTVTTLPVTYASNSDRWFDWVELNYPGIYTSRQTSQIFSGNYYYRCYSAACIASGLGSDIDTLYYLDTSTGVISNLGNVRSHLDNTTTPPNPNDCLFSWAEKNYPSLFAPSGSATAVWSVYSYRYYAATNIYLGVSTSDNHVYYMGGDGILHDAGPTSHWFPIAGCL